MSKIKPGDLVRLKATNTRQVLLLDRVFVALETITHAGFYVWVFDFHDNLERVFHDYDLEVIKDG